MNQRLQIQIEVEKEDRLNLLKRNWELDFNI